VQLAGVAVVIGGIVLATARPRRVAQPAS
jgi:hypothetical protein